MESSCEKITGNREISSPETVKTSSATAPTVTISTSTVKDESERCSQSSLSSETNKLTKKRRTMSPINDQEKNNDNQQLSKCHSNDENFEETNTCKNRGTSNCDENKKCINANEISSDIHQNNEITTCDNVESNNEQISLKVDSPLCETESSDKTDPLKADSSRVTSYSTKSSNMATSPVQMMSKDSNKEESGHSIQVSSLSEPSTANEAVNPCHTTTTEFTKSPTSVIVKAKSATSTTASTTTTTKSSVLSSENSLRSVTTNSTEMTTVYYESKQEDENKIHENVNITVIKEEMRSNQMDECGDGNINDLKKQELCSSDSTNSPAINDTKCNSIIALSSSESSNGDSVNIEKSVQSSPLLSKTVQKNTETSNFSTSYISKDNDKNTKNHENSNDDGEDQIDPEGIPIQKSSAIPTSTIISIAKAETTKTTLSATVEPAVEGISFGLDNILSKAKTLQPNLCIENSVSSLDSSPSMSSQQPTSTKNDIITMSSSPKDLDSLPLQKSGRWNTMHVRISWEILRQQKASQGDKSNTNSSSPLTITPSSRSFNLKSPTIIPPSSSSAASASSISLPTLSKNSHLPYDLIRPPATNIFGDLRPGLQTPQSQSQQQQNQFQPQSHPHSQLPPLHLYHQQNRPQLSTPHSRSLEISSFSASLMNAASGGLNTRLPLDSNPWDHRSQFGPVSTASGHLPYPSFQAPLSSSSLYASGSSMPPSTALSSSSSTSSVSTPSITAPISSLGKINGNTDILRSSNSIFGLPPRPGEMTSFSTSLYNAAVAAAGHGLSRPNLEAWNSPFAPGPGMSSIAAHNFIRSSLPGFPGFPHPHPNPHSTHNNLGLPGSVPTSMSNNLFASLAPPPQPLHSSSSSISSSNLDSLMNTPGRPGSSIFPPLGREEHLPPVSNSSGCGSIPGSGSSSSSSTSTSWGGLKAEAEKSEFGKHKDGTSRNISSRPKDEIRSDSHHHHRSSSNNSTSSSSNNNSKIVGSKHSSSSSNHNGDYELSHRRERDKISNSHKREHSRPSSVSSLSSGNKMMKTSSSAFNDNRSSHINESKAKDDRKESMNNYNKYFDRSHKHSSNSIDHSHRDLKSASLLSSSIGVFNNSNSAILFSTASTASFNNSIMSIPTPPGLPPSITSGNNHSSAASLASMNLHVNNAMDHRARLMGLFGLSHGPPPPPSTPSLCHSMPPSPHGLPGHLSHPNPGSGIPSGLSHDFPKSFWSPFFQPHPGFHEFPPRNDFLEREHLLQQYNILNSSGGGAPLTEKLAKEGPLHALLEKESRDKEAAFASVFDKNRLASSSVSTSTSSSTSSSVNAHHSHLRPGDTGLIAPNPPSLASPFGGPSSLVHGPGNLGLGHALPPPPLPPLSQSHPHPSSSYHHQLHQQHHLNQTSPGQSTPSSSSVLMFPPNPYLNSLHSLSASAGSNVRTDLNSRTKSLSSSASPSSAPSIKQYPHHGAAHSPSPMFIPPLNGLTGPHGFIPAPLVNSKLSTLDTSFEVNCVNRSTISMSNPSTPASGISLADLKESKSR